MPRVTGISTSPILQNDIGRVLGPHTSPGSHVTFGNRRNHFICRRASWRVAILICSMASSSDISPREVIDQLGVPGRFAGGLRELAVTRQQRSRLVEPAGLDHLLHARVDPAVQLVAVPRRARTTRARDVGPPLLAPFVLQRRDRLAGQLVALPARGSSRFVSLTWMRAAAAGSTSRQRRVQLVVSAASQAVADLASRARAFEHAFEQRLVIQRRAAGGDRAARSRARVGDRRVGQLDEAARR